MYISYKLIVYNLSPYFWSQMNSQVPLIQRKLRGEDYEYSICPEGVFLLKSLKSKKLRIIFNISNNKKSLNQFNHWFFNQQTEEDEKQPSACLTISRKMKQLEEDRVIVILTAYECLKEPQMVLLGYLAASVFLYHHFDTKPEINSPLTTLLSKLFTLLSDTDIHDLNSQLSYSKGYAKNPFFLCLLSQEHKPDQFQKIYKVSEETSDLIDFNKAIDTLIDYFPMRNAYSLAFTREKVAAIGSEFEESILGRTVFNFQFTGGTLENLCFDCCEAFNLGNKISLNQFYLKIIENQKVRLEGESLEQFMDELSSKLFFGTKIDMEGDNVFPLSSYDLLSKQKKISDEVLQTSLQSATSCMTLTQFRTLQKKLRKTFESKLNELEQANALKADTLCSRCFDLLENLSQNEVNSDNLFTLLREVQNKLELYASECEVITKGDQIQCLLWRYYNRLFQKYFNHLQSFTREVVQTIVVENQEQRVEIADLRYRIKLRQSDLRALQRQYYIQGQILSETKCKLLHEDDSPPPETYTLQSNKLRRKLQQLQQQVKDKTLYIEELESILERMEGTTKDKIKSKFSKQIQDLMKDISQKVNTYYQVVREAKETNQIEEELRKKFAKERVTIQEERNHGKKEIALRDSEIQKLRKEMFHLERTLQESKHSIEVLKSSLGLSKESINQLERNYAQVNCVLAETQHQLEYYRKGLLLLGQQLKGGKSDKVLKFCNTCPIDQLRNLLRPFVKK